MTAIPVTLLYGGLLVLLVTALGSVVSLSRVALGKRARLGEPTPPELVRYVRAHGNAAEWVPLGIAALLMLELSHAPSLALHVLGGALVGLRLLHAAYAYFKLPFAIIFVVVVLQYGLFAVMGGWALWIHFH